MLKMISSESTGYYYLTEDARGKIKNYQYRGADKSLLYKYVLSPLAELLVNKIVPKSMAPNTITSIGLIWMISAYASHWWYAPSLEFTKNDGDDMSERNESFFPHRWIFLWNGICVLVYQTMDNMDGKQARRTRSSSPLGLLFDHGCDAINSIFGSANVIIELNLSPSEDMFIIWVLVFVPYFVFYVATWEHFLTGELILPIVNGPSEGLLGFVGVSFLSYWHGSQYWQQSDIFESISSVVPARYLMEDTKLRNCDLFILCVLFLAVQEFMLKAPALIRKYKGSAKGLVPMIVLASSFFIIGYIDPNIWLTIPRTSLHLSMFLFVEMTTELMLVHITAQPFFPWRWQISPLIGITFWVAMFGNSDGIQNAIVAYTWAMGVYLLVKCSFIIAECCEVLEIWCFDITTPRQKTKKS